MNTEQIILFTLLFFVFIFLIWGRWRYDLIAFSALVVALLLGVVPKDNAFSGFGHPATAIIALVLIVSRGLSNSGAIELVGRHLINPTRKLGVHIGIMSGFAAVLSAVMNNIAALVLLMQIDLRTAAKAKRSPALTLMPLSFAAILGGMLTLIGTPPNIVISEFRGEMLDAPYRMFDFMPVGAACAVVGVVFVATIGWRLIPIASRTRDSTKELFDIEGYIAEVTVPDTSRAIGKKVCDLDDIAEDNDTAIIGLIRRGKRLPGLARRVEIHKGDILVLEATPNDIEGLVGALRLDYVRKPDTKKFVSDDLALLEVVVPDGARIVGRTAISVGLLYRHSVTLMAVSRNGQRFNNRVRKLKIQVGDVLLLLGPTERLSGIASWLGCLPLAERGLQLIKRNKAGLAIGIFVATIALASTGVLHLPISLACAAALMVMFNIVPLRQLYDSVEWSVVVLLGSMIPIGEAIQASGGTALIADTIVSATTDCSPVVVLVLLIVVTMTLSDIINNTATAIIAAPIALDISKRLDVSPDPFLMGIAVAASCAFLTPIGHKNNTLIMGPGGYRFGDYWRMGLPLEILVVLVATPMIIWIWPL